MNPFGLTLRFNAQPRFSDIERKALGNFMLSYYLAVDRQILLCLLLVYKTLPI